MVYLFQAGVPFSTENAKGTAFRNVYSENKNPNLYIFCDKILNKPSLILNVRNTTSQWHSHQVHQTKTKYPNQNTKYAKQDTKYAKQNTKYAKQNTKYAKQNTNNAKQNTKYAKQNTEYAKQNTEYAKKPQVCQTKPTTPKKSKYAKLNT